MVSKGRKRDESIRRRPPQRQAKHRILILAEGVETEPRYFKDLRNDFRNPRIHVETVGAGAVPFTVVARAIEMRDESVRRAEAERDENLLWDEVWVVFDTDDHPRLEEACKAAHSNQIECAVSNPCFELWALLHFQDQNAHIDRVDLAAKLREYMPGYRKVLDYQKMKQGYLEAVRRAEVIGKSAEQLEEAGRNPTTRIHCLTENIRAK